MVLGRSLIFLAGIPATTVQGSTSSFIKLKAPIAAPSPIVTPGKITQFGAIITNTTFFIVQVPLASGYHRHSAFRVGLELL